MQHVWNLKGRKQPPYWETRSCVFLLNDCIHLRWFRSSCFESWQIGPAVGLLGSLLRSHTLGFNIKRLTESTLNYLFFSFTTVDTSDPHHSCRSCSNTLCFSLSFSRFLHIRILEHRNAHSHVNVLHSKKHILARGSAHMHIHKYTPVEYVARRPCIQADSGRLGVEVDLRLSSFRKQANLRPLKAVPSIPA